jgi:hypothetical protein
MKRRDFITAAAVITAASYAQAELLNSEENKIAPTAAFAPSLNRAFGFFDVDCLEMARGDKWKSVFPNLSIRERAVPLTQSLRALHTIARENRHPFAFTTCCSGRMPKDPSELPETAYIPSGEKETAWKEKLDTHAMFYLEKVHCSSCYKMFDTNSNAAVFFKAQNVERWVLFGNGAETCVWSDALKLLGGGRKVIVLSDVLAYSAKGYGTSKLSGTPAGRAEMLAEIKAAGGELMTLGEFLQEYNYTMTGSRWDEKLQRTVHR